MILSVICGVEIAVFARAKSARRRLCLRSRAVGDRITRIATLRDRQNARLLLARLLVWCCGKSSTEQYRGNHTWLVLIEFKLAGIQVQ